MRDRIVRTLGDLPHSRFLVYLMGPYEAFQHVEPRGAEKPDSPELQPGPVAEPSEREDDVGVDVPLDSHGAAVNLLLFVRDELRTGPGVNAFLALDIAIPLSEMDAATQSIEFAFASNAVVYVVPQTGRNLGVGIEVGAVLEATCRGERTGWRTVPPRHRERVLFVHESGVTSAMIASIGTRWDARVTSFRGRTDLVRQVKLFVRDVARREHRGQLPPLD